MTTKEKIEVMRAFDEGKLIEYKLKSNDDELWVSISCPQWDWDHCIYRVKPESKLRPYRNPEEFLQAQKEHGPYLRVGLRSGTARYYLPIMIDGDNGIVYSDKFQTFFKTYEELMNQRVWQDDSPCGIPEE